MVAVVLVTAINSNGVIDIMLGGDEMLWVSIPVSVEENVVKDDISEEDNGPVLRARPPW